MKFKIDIPDGVIPRGYKPTAFRPILRRDSFIGHAGQLVEGADKSDQPRLIVERDDPPLIRVCRILKARLQDYAEFDMLPGLCEQAIKEYESSL